MSDISDITLRIRVDIVNSAAMLQLVANMNRVQGANKRMTDQLSNSGRLAATMNKAFNKIVGPLKAVEQKFDAVFRAGVHMQSMGRDLLGFAKSVGGAAKSLVDNWGEFQFTLNRAAAAADIFDTQSPLYDKLRDSVNKAAHELRVFPAEEVAKGLYFWQSTTGKTIKTQKDLEDTMKNVTAVMKVAAMTDTSYEQAIKGVYSTLKQFNLGMDQTANVSALLFYATQKTALEFPDLINSLKMTGAVAGNAKEPLESMVAVLGAIGNAGIRGSQAGRALRQTYIKIVKPTAAAKTVLDKLFKSQGGYNKVAFDSKGNFIGIEKYVVKLSKAMKGLNYQQKAHILATITTANELPVMTQMIAAADRAGKNWVDTFADQQKAMEAFNGSWKNLEGSWKGVVGGLKNAVGPVLQQIGKTIADVLTPSLNELNVVIWDNVPAFSAMGTEIVESFRPVIEWAAKAVKKVIEWAKANPKLVKAFAKWGIIAAIVSGVAGAILLAAGTFTFLLSNVVILIAGMLPLIGMFVAAGAIIVVFARQVYKNVGGIQQALRAFGEAVWRVLKLFIFGTDGAKQGVMDLSGVIDKFAAGAVSKLADWLTKIADVLNRLTPEDVAVLKGIAKGLLAIAAARKVLGFTAARIRDVSGALKNLEKDAKTVKDSVVKSFDAIKAGAKGMKNITIKVSSTVTSAAGKGVDYAAQGTEMAIKFIGGFVAGLAGAAATAIAAAVSLPALIVGALVAAVIAALALAYANNWFGFKDFVDGIVNWFTTVALPAITGIAQGIIDAFINGLSFIVNGVGNIVSWIGSIPGAIADGLTSIINSIVAFLQDFASRWDYYLGYILGVIIALPIKIVIEIVKFGVNLVTTLVGIFVTVIGAVVKWVGDFLTTVVNFLISLPGKFVEFFGKVWNVLSTWFINTAKDMISWGATLIGNLVDFFVKLPGRVLNFMGEVWTTISTWFIETAPKVAKAAGDLVAGIIKFFTDLPGNIVTALKDLPTTLSNVFKNLAEAGSKLIRAIIGIGEAIVRGLWEGITNMVGWFTDKVGGFFGGLVDGIKDTLGIKSPSRVMAGIGDQMIAGLGVGIEKSKVAHDAMYSLMSDLSGIASNASASIGASASGTLTNSITTDSTKSIDLNVNVTSADGSINSMDMSTLASLITGSDMTRALERMATVD